MTKSCATCRARSLLTVPSRANTRSMWVKAALTVVTGPSVTTISSSSTSTSGCLPDEAARDAHANGQIVAALGANEHLLGTPPETNPADVLAVKMPHHQFGIGTTPSGTPQSASSSGRSRAKADLESEVKMSSSSSSWKSRENLLFS